MTSSSSYTTSDDEDEAFEAFLARNKDEHREPNHYLFIAEEREGPYYDEELNYLKFGRTQVKNRLCPSYYDSKIECISKGDLELSIEVNGKTLILNSQDVEHNKKSILYGKSYYGTYAYSFMGVGVYVKNHNRDETFLVVEILTLDTKSIPPESVTLKYNLNQPFLIELAETPGTGFSWSLELPKEVVLITEAFSSPQTISTGGGGTRTYVLKAVSLTQDKVILLTATYSRPWEKGIVAVEPKNVRNFELTIQ